MNSTWCSGSSSSKTSASSSRSCPTASMISSPSSWEAASTRSAIWAGCSRASFRYGMRRCAVGTWETKGSMLPQSTMAPARVCCPRRPGSSRRRMPRVVGSTPTTSQPLLFRDSSISLARISRPPTKLMRWRAFRSFANSSSPGRRSKRRRSTRSPSNLTRPGSMAEILRTGTNRSRPAIETTAPTMGGCGVSPIRTMRSRTRPSRSPLRSTRGRLITPERWMRSVATVSFPAIVQGRIELRRLSRSLPEVHEPHGQASHHLERGAASPQKPRKPKLGAALIG